MAARVLVVDDMASARQALRVLLSTWPGAGALREAGSGPEAVRLVAEWQPDLVLMDVRMQGMDGVEATRRIKAADPAVKVVVLSVDRGSEAAARAAGADEFVGKGDPPQCLLQVLDAVAGKTV